MPKTQLSPALKGLLLSSCALALPAMAQEQTAEQYVEECVDLFAFVEDSDAYVLDEEPEILAVIETNRSAECRRMLAQLEREAQTGEPPAFRAARRPVIAAPAIETAEDTTEEAAEEDTVTAQATETVEEDVTVQETVTVTGEVDIAMPVPMVEVDQRAAEVEVRQQNPRVSIDRAAPEILIREQAPIVRISAPTVTIEQAPPEIIITMPDPTVDIASAEPQVEVRQAEPQVRVTLGEPQVGLDLRAVSGDEAGERVSTRISRLEEGTPQERDGMRLLAGADEGMDANVYVAQAEPEVRMRAAEGQPEISMNSAEPNLRYERAEPQVEMTGEPQVEISQTGEPTVTVRRPGEEEPEQQDQAQAALERDQATRLTRRGEEGPFSGGMATVRVSELLGAEIEGANGEEIGEIERLVKLDGAIYAVVEHGGFLGIGEDVFPMPLNGLTLVDGELTAPGVTEEDMEEWSERDMTGAIDLEGRDGVRLRQG